MNKLFEIDFKRLILELIYKSWIIVLVAAICGVGYYMYARKTLVPRYTAGATLYVNSRVDDPNKSQSVTKVSSSEISTAKALVKTYLTFLTSEQVLDTVSKGLNNAYSASQLRGMMNAQAVEGTEVFNITVTSTSPEEAAKIANAIADIAPSVITQYIEGSSVKIVDYAKIPTSRSFPNYRKYLEKGGIAGAGVSIIIIILLFLFNSKISTEEDITNLFEAPVIGKIPNYHQLMARSGYTYKYAYRQKDGRQRK